MRDRKNTVDYLMGCSQSTVGDYIWVCEDTLHARESGWALNEALDSSTMQFCASFPQSEVAADLLFLHSLCLEIIRPNKPCHLRGSFHQVPCGHAIMPCQLIIRSFGGGVRDVSQASAHKPFLGIFLIRMERKVAGIEPGGRSLGVPGGCFPRAVEGA